MRWCGHIYSSPGHVDKGLSMPPQRNFHIHVKLTRMWDEAVYPSTDEQIIEMWYINTMTFIQP